MNDNIEIIERLAEADYNGDEECTEAFAAKAIRLARKEGWSSVDGAADAIEALGFEAAVRAYIKAWAAAHEAEYSNTEEEV